MAKKDSGVPFAGTQEQEQKLRNKIRQLEKTHTHNDALMPALQEAQEIYGYLPIEVQKIVADELGVFLEKVYGVATFYSQFSITPKGEYTVSVCMGTACYVKGAGDVLHELEKELGLDTGGVSPDGKFSLEACRCIGACGLAPVITINDDVYGRLKVEDVKEVLAKY